MILTAKEISEIILSCKSSGVTEIDVTKTRVRIVFSSKPIAEENPQVTKPIETTIPSHSEVKFTDMDESPSERIKEDIDDLRITDPASFEELLTLGEIVKDAWDAEKNNRGPEQDL